MPRRPLLRPATLAAGVALVLAACAASPPPDVRVSLYQPRPDVAAGRMAIQVHNDGADPLDLRGARLESDVFAAPAGWSDDSAIVLPGRALDLRVDLPELRCAESAAPPRVELTLADGTAIVLGAEDPYALLERFAADACLVAAVEEIAALGPATLATRGGAEPADFVLPVRTTGAPGSFTIDAAFATTLLQPAVDGVGVPEAPVGVAIEHGGPAEVRIPLVPNRCDAHALAEDKVGTRIPLRISTRELEGTLVVPADDALRAAMAAFFREYCGL